MILEKIKASVLKADKGLHLLLDLMAEDLEAERQRRIALQTKRLKRSKLFMTVAIAYFTFCIGMLVCLSNLEPEARFIDMFWPTVLAIIGMMLAGGYKNNVQEHDDSNCAMLQPLSKCVGEFKICERALELLRQSGGYGKAWRDYAVETRGELFKFDIEVLIYCRHLFQEELHEQQQKDACIKLYTDAPDETELDSTSGNEKRRMTHVN